MRAQIKELPLSKSRPIASGRDWKVLSPQPAGGDDVMEIHAALRHAEAIIRTQHERIKNLEEMAMLDELTGLANRRGFNIALKRELALARRDADYGGILVMIDLEELETIKNARGYQTGDAYLCAVANVLREGVRANDTIAYLGDGKFAALLTHMDELMGARRLARWEAAFERKSVLPQRLSVCANFGFAAYTGTSGAEAVMQTAELRLRAHKSPDRKSISVG